MTTPRAILEFVGLVILVMLAGIERVLDAVDMIVWEIKTFWRDGK